MPPSEPLRLEVAPGKVRLPLEAYYRDPRFRDDRGRPNFNVVFYCLTKDGKYAAAHIHGPASLAVHDGDSARMVDSASLLD